MNNLVKATIANGIIVYAAFTNTYWLIVTSFVIISLGLFIVSTVAFYSDLQVIKDVVSKSELPRDTSSLDWGIIFPLASMCALGYNGYMAEMLAMVMLVVGIRISLGHFHTRLLRGY